MTLSTNITELERIVAAAVKKELLSVHSRLEGIEAKPGLAWPFYLVSAVLGFALGWLAHP